MEALETTKERIVEDTKKRIIAAITCIRENDRKVSFYLVAKIAHVSRSTLYRNANLRQLVESARDGSEPAIESSRLDELEARIAQLESEIAHLLAAEKTKRDKSLRTDLSDSYWLIDFGCAA